MRSLWKGTISFGLVTIPVALGVATQRSDPKFRTLDAKTLQPIKQQLYSPAREETIEREETVKGYEVSKDQYLPMTDEELEAVAVERRRSIDIVAFVDAEDVDPVYYDRTYYLQPQEHAEKPYRLLLEAMRDTGKAALGKIVLSSREHLALLRPAGDALVIELLFYPEDVRPKDEIEDSVRETKIQDAELDMAKQLVDSLTRPFEPGEFENEHKRELLALIERKLMGEEPVPVAEAASPEPVPDLMSALKASLDQAKSQQRSGGAAPSSGDGEAPAPKKRSRAGANGDGTEPKPKARSSPRKKPAKSKS
jgi:DNA end-binding protein Ku